MSTKPEWLRRLRPPALDELLDASITAGLAVLLAVGFVASYTTLLDLAVTVGDYPRWLAPAVPLAFDLGIVVLSLKVVRAAREGRTAPFLRLLVVALSIATVAANAAAASSPAGALLHAVPPAMFVVCFESVIASTRRHSLERLGLVPPKLPRVRGVRWALSPLKTFFAWRTAVLDRELFESSSRPAKAASGAVRTVRKPTAEVVPAAPAPVVGAAVPVDPQKSPQKSRPISTAAGVPTARVIAEEVAALCSSSADVVEQTRHVLNLADYEVSPKTAERVRKHAREILEEVPA